MDKYKLIDLSINKKSHEGMPKEELMKKLEYLITESISLAGDSSIIIAGIDIWDSQGQVRANPWRELVGYDFFNHVLALTNFHTMQPERKVAYASHYFGEGFRHRIYMMARAAMIDEVIMVEPITVKADLPREERTLEEELRIFKETLKAMGISASSISHEEWEERKA